MSEMISVKSESGKFSSSSSSSTFSSVGGVRNIVRRLIPADIPIDEDAIALIHECMLDFISSVSLEAINRSCTVRRQFLDENDISNSMFALGYNEYVEPLRKYMNKRAEHMAVCTSCTKGEKDEKRSKLADKSVVSKPVPTIPQPEEPVVVINKRASRKKADEAPIPIVQENSNKEQKIGKKKLRTDWSDPIFVKEVSRSLEEAMTKNADQDQFIREIAKKMHLPLRELRAKFTQLTAAHKKKNANLQNLQQQQPLAGSTSSFSAAVAGGMNAMVTEKKRPLMSVSSKNPMQSSSNQTTTINHGTSVSHVTQSQSMDITNNSDTYGHSSSSLIGNTDEMVEKNVFEEEEKEVAITMDVEEAEEAVVEDEEAEENNNEDDSEEDEEEGEDGVEGSIEGMDVVDDEEEEEEGIDVAVEEDSSPMPTTTVATSSPTTSSSSLPTL